MALILAAGHADPTLIRFLLDKGADRDLKYKWIKDKRRKDKQGRTALDYTKQADNTKVLKILVDL